MFRIDHIDIPQIFQGILYKYRLFVVLSKNCKRRTKYNRNGNAFTIINTIGQKRIRNSKLREVRLTLK